MRDTVSHDACVHSADALLPLIAFLEQASFNGHVFEVIDIGGVLVEIIWTIGPDGRGQSSKDAFADRDV